MCISRGDVDWIIQFKKASCFLYHSCKQTHNITFFTAFNIPSSNVLEQSLRETFRDELASLFFPPFDSLKNRSKLEESYLATIPWDDVFTSISKHIRGHILSIIEDYHEHWNNFGSERAKQLFVENYERSLKKKWKIPEIKVMTLKWAIMINKREIWVITITINTVKLQLAE